MREDKGDTVRPLPIDHPVGGDEEGKGEGDQRKLVFGQVLGALVEYARKMLVIF